MNSLDAPAILTPVTENYGSDHYAARILGHQRNGRTLQVMPEWAIVAAYLGGAASPAEIAAEVTKVNGMAERQGNQAWHPYCQAALRSGSFAPKLYTLRKDGRYRPQGAGNYGALTIGVAVNGLDPSF